MSVLRPILDPLAHFLTGNLRRIFPDVPLLDEWPPTGRILVGGYWVVFGRLHDAVAIRRAVRRRARLPNLMVVGVTGSAGKSMTKELIAAILETKGPCQKTPQSRNRVVGVARTLLGARAAHRYCVVEMGAGSFGEIARAVRIARPDIATVTTIGDDHFTSFGDRRVILREKTALPTALPPNGTAVLNADDPLVASMEKSLKVPVLTYGLSPGAAFRARDISGGWPERLTFTLTWQDHDHQVRTRLIGRHWMTAVLAALATGVAAGVPIEDAIEAVAGVEPLPGRMSPVTFPTGVTFLRDDWKAPAWSLPLALEVVRESRAERKIVIIGTLSDYQGEAGRSYLRTARMALDAADQVFFVGPNASHALKARDSEMNQRLRAFASLRDLHDHLGSLLRSGDLVLIKGNHRADHLERLILAEETAVTCWRSDCGLEADCDRCCMLNRPKRCPVGSTVHPPNSAATGRAVPDTKGVRVQGGAARIIIGLGNPGGTFADTPHNIGWQVLDRLARRMAVRWHGDGEVIWGEARSDHGPLLLVKPATVMNDSGPVLLRLSQRFGFEPKDCILVFDDDHLPFGSLRFREKGSDGGHLGVRSILMAFQTVEFRRIKLGIGRPKEGRKNTFALLKPWPKWARGQADELCDEAAQNVLNLIARDSGSGRGQGIRSGSATFKEVSKS